jgi:hypothetical protein
VGKTRLAASEGPNHASNWLLSSNALLAPVNPHPLNLVLMAVFARFTFCGFALFFRFLRRPFPDRLAFFTDFSEFASVGSGLRKRSSLCVIPCMGSRTHAAASQYIALRKNCARASSREQKGGFRGGWREPGSWRPSGKRCWGGQSDSIDAAITPV